MIPAPPFLQATALTCERDGRMLFENLDLLAGLLLIVPGKCLHFVLQAFDGFIIGIQCFYFIQQLLLQRGHFTWLDAVLARQCIDSIKTLFKLLQSGRVGVEVIQKTVQFAYRFFNLYLRAGQQTSGLAKGGRRMVDAAQPMQAGSQGIEHVAGIAFAALLDHLSANAQQAFGVSQVFVFLLELLKLVFAQAQAFQLFELIAEQLMACALLVP